MSEIYDYEDHVMLVADYKNPSLHKHLALHLMISLGGEMVWQIKSEMIKCHAIFINSNVMHTGQMSKEGAITFLFIPTGQLAKAIEKQYLKGNAYCILDKQLACQMIKAYEGYGENEKVLHEILLDLCGIGHAQGKQIYDERINEVFEYLSSLKTIEHHIVDELSQKVCLSKSRLSHLFKEETGMSLHSYLAFEKAHKTIAYNRKGMTITQACLLAGFDSPSHYSATCKRMFGIALSEVNKSIKDSN